MNKSTVYFLLLTAAVPQVLAAQSHELTKSSEKLDEKAVNGSIRNVRVAKQHLSAIPSSMVLGKDVKFGGYEVRTYRAGEEKDPLQAFEILKSGRRLYSKVDSDGLEYNIGCVNDNDVGNLKIRPGRDITGEGKPNIVISDWTGGAHCCFKYFVFELGDDVKEIGRINAAHGDNCRFHDEQNGKIDFVINDWTFAYWATSFAESPAPKIILRYRDGGYAPATDLMVKATPSLEEFQKLVEEGRHLPLDDEGWPSSKFWGIMLDLIYSGHADLAWKFCGKAWPGPVKTKQSFLDAFRLQLSKSTYWPAIKAMNGL